MSDDDLKEMLNRFKLVCRKCGSEDVHGSAESGVFWGGQTGYQAGTIAIGCNTCKENDWQVDQ